MFLHLAHGIPTAPIQKLKEIHTSVINMPSYNYLLTKEMLQVCSLHMMKARLSYVIVGISKLMGSHNQFSEHVMLWTSTIHDGMELFQSAHFENWRLDDLISAAKIPGYIQKQSIEYLGDDLSTHLDPLALHRACHDYMKSGSNIGKIAVIIKWYKIIFNEAVDELVFPDDDQKEEAMRIGCSLCQRQLKFFESLACFSISLRHAIMKTVNGN